MGDCLKHRLNLRWNILLSCQLHTMQRDSLLKIIIKPSVIQECHTLGGYCSNVTAFWKVLLPFVRYWDRVSCAKKSPFSVRHSQLRAAKSVSWQTFSNLLITDMKYTSNQKSQLRSDRSNLEDQLQIQMYIYEKRKRLCWATRQNSICSMIDWSRLDIYVQKNIRDCYGKQERSCLGCSLGRSA